MLQKIKDYILAELSDIETYITVRAKEYSTYYSKEALFDLGMDKEPVCSYSQEDFANHNFDLGAWYQLNNILKLIEDGK
jgi:hypothetical protein